MNYYKIILPFLLFNVPLSLHAQPQKEDYFLNKQENALIELINRDTVHSLQLRLDANLFKFGYTETKLNTVVLLKDRATLWIQLMGTGRLFKVIERKKGKFSLHRIDSTFFSGANFNALTFILNDTIFQFGGDGFWNIRGFMTYYNPKTHEWEMYNTDKLVHVVNDNHFKVVFQVDTGAKKLYLSNKFERVNFPNTLNIEFIDTCFEFDFRKHKWTALGNLNPNLRKLIESSTVDNFQIGHYIILQNQLEFYWINFATNSYGITSTAMRNQIKETWLTLYNTKKGYDALQFSLGNKVYLVKIDDDKNLTYATFDLKPSDFDFSKQNLIYTPTNTLLLFFQENLTLIIWVACIVIFLFVITYYLIVKIKKKKAIPKQVTIILYDNFFQSLSIVEKELIEVLYQHQLKGESISTKLINKIIGVQQKDTMTQNKNRSDYFLKINQKFKLATQNKLPLIIKNRDNEDKRQFNYSLQEAYQHHIAKLFKKN